MPSVWIVLPDEAVMNVVYWYDILPSVWCDCDTILVLAPCYEEETALCFVHSGPWVIEFHPLTFLNFQLIFYCDRHSWVVATCLGEILSKWSTLVRVFQPIRDQDTEAWTNERSRALKWPHVSSTELTEDSAGIRRWDPSHLLRLCINIRVQRNILFWCRDTSLVLVLFWKRFSDA